MAVAMVQGYAAEAVTENSPFTCLVIRLGRRNSKGLRGEQSSASARVAHTIRHDVPRRTRAEGQRGADRVAAQPPDGSRGRPVRLQGLSRRGRTLVRPEAKTPQTGRYHARFQRPDPRRTHAWQLHLEPANCSFYDEQHT